MPFLHNHGGGCCGIQNMEDMGSGSTYAELRQDIDQKITICKAQRMLLEVVLVSEQMFSNMQTRRMSPLAKYLKKKGFSLVSSFRNGNSGNMCYILHYHPDLERAKYPSNKRWF